MTTKEYQTELFNRTGLKISVQTCTGSMKGYHKFWPQYQKGNYPNFDHEFIEDLRNENTGKNIFTVSDIHIFGLESSECVKFKRESKPKEITEMKVRTWGSKNSQMRLDKRTATNAKRMQKGNTARYY